MAHIQLVKQTSSGLLLPATPESCDFLHQIKIGEWIHADFKRVRNYAFHKRFFKLLQLGFDYWTPVGGRSRLANENWCPVSLITCVNQ
ncbi:phage protein [Escherichia coli]|nr:phage protein [Escherichia coli]